VQTFLPFPDLAASAEVLDDRRLGKQRVETLQILRALTCEGYGWASHPAVTMWRGHVPALATYGLTVVGAWTDRGYADTTAELIAEFTHGAGPLTPAELHRSGALPPWWGNEAVHRSHRSALLRKDPAWYAPRLPADTPDDLDYVWPDPPAPPPPEPGERTAWVVRGVREGRTLAVAPLGPIGAGGAAPKRGTKRDRQLRRLTEEIAAGDLVVVPIDGELDVVEVAGADEDAAGRHTRRVRPLGRLERTELTRPAVLQDPQVVFPLYDEPAVAALAGTG
jgi:hypothetical protein